MSNLPPDERGILGSTARSGVVLANLIPGFREIRAPLISGYVWLVFFYLALHEGLPSRDDAGSVLKPLFELGDRLSVVGLVTVASVAAYLVGSAMQELLKLLSRRFGSGEPLYAEAGVHTSSVGKASIASTVKVRGEAITRRLLQQALTPGERGIDSVPTTQQVERDLPVVRMLLLGEKPELVAELDRLQAEADLRITVAFPLAALSLLLGFESSAGWWIVLLPAVLLLSQGFQRQRDAGDFLARVLHIGRAEAPAISNFEITVNAALDRVELEWQLRREIEGSEDGMAAFRLGNLQATAGESKLAAESLRLAADRGVLQAYGELGFACERLGDHAGAERAYRDGDERGDRKASERLAAFLTRQGRGEEARETAKKAEERSPRGDEGTSAQPMELELPGEDARLRQYREGAEGGDAKAAINLGLLLARQGHGEQAIAAFRQATAIDPEDGSAWLQLGIAHGRSFEVPAALEAFERALSIQEARFSPDHLEVAATLDSIAEGLRLLGRYEEAASSLFRALQIKEKSLGSEHPEVAAARGDFALVVDQLGRTREAIPLQKEAMEVIERKWGSNNLALARMQANYANMLHRIGEYDQARTLHERALAIKEEHLPPDDRSIGLSVGNLGALLISLGQYGRAIALEERALANAEGEADRLSLLCFTSNLARALQGSGQPGKALPLHEEVMAGFVEIVGSEGVDFAEAEADFARTLHDLGMYEQARVAQLHALRVIAEQNEDERVLTAEIQRGLSRTLADLGVYAEADRLARSALEDFEANLSSDHLEVGRTLVAMGTAAIGLGDLHRALNVLERGFAILEQRLGPEGNEICAALVELGRALRHLRRFEEAEDTLGRAQISADANPVETNRLRPRIERELAATAFDRGDTQKAASLIESAIATSESVLGPGHPYLVNALILGSEIYSKLGDSDRAAELGERAKRVGGNPASNKIDSWPRLPT